MGLLSPASRHAHVMQWVMRSKRRFADAMLPEFIKTYLANTPDVSHTPPMLALVT